MSNKKHGLRNQERDIDYRYTCRSHCEDIYYTPNKHLSSEKKELKINHREDQH